MKKSISTFDEFKKELVANRGLQDEFRQDPVTAIQKFQEQSPLQTDNWIYRIIVGALGATILLIIIGIIILIYGGKLADDNSIPTIFTAIGSAAIGALAGLLAPAPRDTK